MGSNYFKIGYSSIKVFGDDGTLDMEELNFLLGLALKDDNIDENEKEALKAIFSKITKNDVNKKVWERILAICDKYSISYLHTE